MNDFQLFITILSTNRADIEAIVTTTANAEASSSNKVVSS